MTPRNRDRDVPILIDHDPRQEVGFISTHPSEPGLFITLSDHPGLTKEQLLQIFDGGAGLIILTTKTLHDGREIVLKAQLVEVSLMTKKPA